MTIKRIFRFMSVFILIFFATTIANSQNTLTGTIHDVDGRPIDKVVVTAPELGLRAYTNDQGQFVLQLKPDVTQIVLVFDAPGYYSQTFIHKLQAAPTTFDVSMLSKKVEKQEITVNGSMHPGSTCRWRRIPPQLPSWCPRRFRKCLGASHRKRRWRAYPA